MATTPKKPVPPKAPIPTKAKATVAPKAAAKPPVAVAKKAVPAAKPPAPAPKPVAMAEAPTPAPVPVIIAEPVEPVAPPAPAKLTLVASAPAPSLGKKLDSASMMKGYEDLTLFGKDNFDALIKANALFAKGLEHFGKEVIGMAQAHMEEATKLTKAMLLAKNLQEVVVMHTELTKSSIEKLVADSSALSELGMKVTNEAMAPISARVTLAVEKIRELTAA